MLLTTHLATFNRELSRGTNDVAQSSATLIVVPAVTFHVGSSDFHLSLGNPHEHTCVGFRALQTQL